MDIRSPVWEYLEPKNSGPRVYQIQGRVWWCLPVPGRKSAHWNILTKRGRWL